MINQIHCGDCMELILQLERESLNLVVTSPPYWGLRDYGNIATDIADWQGALGNEATMEKYIEHLVIIFRELKRILRPDGNFFLNVGDTYFGAGRHSLHSKGAKETLNQAMVGVKHRQISPPFKRKDLAGIPWRLAFALQEDGWYLRSGAPWVKRSCMPDGSATDCFANALEYVFHLTVSGNYFFNVDAIRMPYANQGKPRRFAKKGNSDEMTQVQFTTPSTKVGGFFGILTCGLKVLACYCLVKKLWVLMSRRKPMMGRIMPPFPPV